MARRSRPRGWPAPPEPLPVPVIDGHTHLDAVLEVVVEDVPPEPGAAPPPPSPRSLDGHLALARAVGVVGAVQVGCDLESARWTDGVVRERAELVGAVAVHPNEAVLHAGVRELAPDGLEPHPLPRHDVPLEEAVTEIARIARDNPRVRAIGETGLDFFRAGERGRAVQREAFRAHVALAKELGLPLQIHDREAHADVVDVLLRDGAPEVTVFHCFSGDEALARLCVARGWYLSFAGSLTYRANDELRRALRAAPLELVLVETDAPYLPPMPHRGRPNAPYLVPLTVRAVAQVHDRPLADVCERLYHTAASIYGM